MYEFTGRQAFEAGEDPFPNLLQEGAEQSVRDGEEDWLETAMLNLLEQILFDPKMS